GLRRSACVPMSSARLLRLAGFGHGNGDRLLPAAHLLPRAALQRALLMFVHHLVDLLLLRRRGHELSPKNCLTRKRSAARAVPARNAVAGQRFNKQTGVKDESTDAA